MRFVLVLSLRALVFASLLLAASWMLGQDAVPSPPSLSTQTTVQIAANLE